MDSHNIMFIILAAIIACSSLACVLSKSIIRAATYLFFALLGTAGLYFLHLPWFCPGHGLCRWRCCAVRLRHPADKRKEGSTEREYEDKDICFSSPESGGIWYSSLCHL